MNDARTSGRGSLSNRPGYSHRYAPRDKTSSDSPKATRDWFILPHGAPRLPKPSAGAAVEHELESITSYHGEVVPVPDHIDMGDYIDMRPAIDVIRKCQPRFKSEVYDTVAFPAHVGSRIAGLAYALLWDVSKEDAKDGMALFQTHQHEVSTIGRHGCLAYVAQCHRGNERWAAGFRASIGYHRITCHPAGEEALVQFRTRTEALRAAALMIRRWVKRVEAERRETSPSFERDLAQLRADIRAFVHKIDDHRVTFPLDVELKQRLN